MRIRIRSRIARLCACLALIGFTAVGSTLVVAGTAGADTEIASGQHFASTGWVHEPFYSCQDDDTAAVSVGRRGAPRAGTMTR
jgi:hypothetical protein